MIFIRHPRPDVPPNTCYGQLDLDIHREGHAQIERACELVTPVRRIVASPALRCRKLAESLAAFQSLEPEFDERLLEMDMGDWEGMLWSDIPRGLCDAWLADPYNNACPNGESFRDLQSRVLAALDTLDDETAVVCHAGPIRAVQMAWHGLTFREAFATAPPYAEPVELRRGSA